MLNYKIHILDNFLDPKKLDNYYSPIPKTKDKELLKGKKEKKNQQEQRKKRKLLLLHSLEAPKKNPLNLFDKTSSNVTYSGKLFG